MGYLTDQSQHEYYSSNLPTTDLGGYQFLSLSDIIDNFMATFVGDGKILAAVLRGDVSFHAHRALAELSFDTLKSCKSQEIVLPPSLTMMLPQDYVNYTKVTWSDDNGIEHVLYPASKTSNPQTIQQDEDGEYLFIRPNQDLMIDHIEATVLGIDKDSTGPFKIQAFGEGYIDASVSSGVVSLTPDTAAESPLKVGMEVKSEFFPPGTVIDSISHTVGSINNLPSETEFYTNNATINSSILNNSSSSIMFIDNTSGTTWGKYKSSGSNQVSIDQATTTDPAVDADNYFQNTGGRFGLDGQYAQANGSFFIDCNSGKIHFSSNISGKTVILHYISDSLGTDKEMQVPKLAEEAIYKWIAYGCLSVMANVPENIVQRFKREKFAETRKAKIRLSNIKIEEISQVIRGKSKWIKH